MVSSIQNSSYSKTASIFSGFCGYLFVYLSITVVKSIRLGTVDCFKEAKGNSARPVLGKGCHVQPNCKTGESEAHQSQKCNQKVRETLP